MEGVWARGTSEKNWDPYVFLQPLKLAISNLVHNFGLGLPYQKTTFKTKIGGGLGQRNIPQKIWESLLISATVEASNFKFVMQLGFWTSLPKTTFRTKIGGAWARGASGNIWDRYLFLQPIKKIGTQQVYFAKHKF